MQAFEHALPPRGRSAAISFQANERTFFSILDDVLRKRGSSSAEKLAEFGWSGGCGFGSDSLSDPQSIGIFLALLNEGRTAEAVGAALAMQSEEPLVTAGETKDARIEFLKKCGLDWEALLAGAQIEADRRNSHSSHAPYLQELAAFGSEHAALLLMQMLGRAPAAMRAEYAEALATFIPGDTENISMSRPMRLERLAKLALSPEMKMRVLAALQELATPTSPTDVAKATIIGFARAKAEETKPTLRGLLHHPSSEVAQAAAQILRSLGETVAPVSSEPVRFQVLINGAPVSEGTGIEWQIDCGGGSTSSGKKAEVNGIVPLERKYFLEQDRKASAVHFCERGALSPDGICFFVTLPPPQNLDAITPVAVKLVPVEVRIARNDSSRSGDALVKIARHQEEGALETGRSASFDHVPREAKVALGEPFHISMQSGSYEVEVQAPGAERLKKIFTVANEATILHLPLAPGGDVRFQIVRPDGEKDAQHVLLKNGQQMENDYFDFHGRIYRGLPTGNYILHIPASGELIARNGRSDFVPLHGYAGRDVLFTIAGNSTEPLDLGEIRLTAASQ